MPDLDAVRKADRLLWISFISTLIVVNLLDYPMMPALKVSILRVGTAAIAAVWLWKCRSSDEPCIKWSPCDLFLAAFLVLAAASTALAMHFQTALQGRYTRFEGFLTLINYALVYFLAMQAAYSASRTKRLAEALAALGGLLGLHGLLQYLGIDPLGAHAYVFWEKGRAYSVFGNPNIYAGFMALTFPLALASALTASSKRGQVAYVTALLLISGGLLVSFTRGSWLAALIGLLLFPVLAGRDIGPRAKTLATALLLLVVFAGFIAAVTAGSDNPVTNVGRRAASILGDRGGSVAERFEIWKTAAKVVASHPLFGVGPDSLHFAFYRYETERLAELGKGMQAADNAHNYFLNLAAGVGAPATGLQALFFALLFAYAIAGLRDKEGVEKLAIAGLVTAAISYFANLQTSVGSVETTSAFWALLGAISGQLKISRIKTFSGGRAGRGRALAGTVTAIAALLLALTLRVLLGDAYHAGARQARISGTPETIRIRYEKAIAIYPHEDVLVGAGEFALGASKLSPNPALLSWGVDILREATTYEPQEPRLWTLLGELLLQEAKTGDFGPISEARKSLTQALKIHPRSFRARFALGDLYLLEGKSREAADAFERSLKLNPEDPTALFLLGKCYEDLGAKGKAIQAYRRALEIAPNYPDAKVSLEKLKSYGGR